MGYVALAAVGRVRELAWGARVRRRGVVVVAAGAAAVWAAALAGMGAANAGDVSASSGRVPAAGSWGKAIELPGSGVLNARGYADLGAVSCPAAGSCAAGGSYLDGSGHEQGFVVSQRHGTWGRPTAIPGLGALNKGGNAYVLVSCASPGNCVAVGDYSERVQGFQVTERDGVWGKATQIPGLAALNRGKQTVVSCASPGNCAAGGFYQDSPSDFPAFVVSERHGRWGKAIQVPGLRALDMYTGDDAQITHLSCAPRASYCAAGGIYFDRSGHLHGFIVSERHDP